MQGTTKNETLQRYQKELKLLKKKIKELTHSTQDDQITGPSCYSYQNTINPEDNTNMYIPVPLPSDPESNMNLYSYGDKESTSLETDVNLYGEGEPLGGSYVQSVGVEGDVMSEDEGETKGNISKWDKDFMSLLKREKTEEVLEKYLDLYDEFTSTASTFTRSIIGERHIEEHLKKVQPMDVGGFAGGTKFEVHGLFFKCPIDKKIGGNQWLYGSSTPNHVNALKASNHDFKGLVSFALSCEHNFQIPTFAIVDYQGHRMVVMTTLPITSNSLLFGSDDAGKTMHSDEDIKNELIRISKTWNLRVHKVTKAQVETPICGDGEIHQFLFDDQKIYYALDMARLFPPTQYFSDNITIYYQLFRPEFLKEYPVSLSSDALSNWQNDPFGEELNSDIKNATVYLFNVVIPAFAKELFEIPTLMEQKAIKNPKRNEIIHKLHSKGINLRYLGLVLLELDKLSKKCETLPDHFNSLFEYLSSFALVRVIKNLWRRTIISNSNDRVHSFCLKQTIDLLNLMLCIQTQIPSQFLNEFIETFANSLSDIQRNDIVTLYKEVLVECFSKPKNINWIILSFCESCGVVLSEIVKNQIESGLKLSFSAVDIDSFKTKIKIIPHFQYYTGLYYLQMGLKEKIRQNQISLLEEAEERLYIASQYTFPRSKYYHTKALINLMYMNKNLLVDTDEILNVLSLELKQRNKTDKEYFEIFLEYTSIKFWQIFCDVSKTYPILNDYNTILHTISVFYPQLAIVDTNSLQYQVILTLLWENILKSYGLIEKEVDPSFQKFWGRYNNWSLEVKNLFGKREFFTRIELHQMIKNHPNEFKHFLNKFQMWDIDLLIRQFFLIIFEAPGLSVNKVIQNFLSQSMLIKKELGDILLYPTFIEVSQYSLTGIEDKNIKKLIQNIDQEKPIIVECIKTLETQFQTIDKKEYLPIIHFIISNGADVNRKNDKGETILHILCKEKRLDIIQFLIQEKLNINPNSINNEGDTALHLACGLHDLELVKFLSSLTTPAVRNKDGMTPLYIAARSQSDEITRFMIEYEQVVLLNPKETILHHMVKRGDQTTIKHLLTHLPITHIIPNKDGMSPFHLACQLGEKVFVEMCMKEKYNIEEKDNNGWNPLHYAVNGGQSKIVDLLLRGGCNPNALTNEGDNTLHLASFVLPSHQASYDIDLLKSLLEYKVDPNHINKNQRTPLHIAYCFQFQQAIDLLKTPQSEVIKDKDGYLPQDYVRKQDKPSYQGPLTVKEIHRNEQNFENLIIYYEMKLPTHPHLSLYVGPNLMKGSEQLLFKTISFHSTSLMEVIHTKTTFDIKKLHILDKKKPRIMFQLIKAISFLQQNNVAHFNLRPSNVLLINEKNTWNVKILGASPVPLIKGDKEDTFHAPEVLKNNYSLKSDLYSLGLLLLSICTFQHPDSFISEETPKVPDWIGVNLKKEITDLLQSDPEMRSLSTTSNLTTTMMKKDQAQILNMKLNDYFDQEFTNKTPQNEQDLVLFFSKLWETFDIIPFDEATIKKFIIFLKQCTSFQMVTKILSSLTKPIFNFELFSESIIEMITHPLLQNIALSRHETDNFLQRNKDSVVLRIAPMVKGIAMSWLNKERNCVNHQVIDEKAYFWEFIKLRLKTLSTPNKKPVK